MVIANVSAFLFKKKNPLLNSVKLAPLLILWSFEKDVSVIWVMQLFCPPNLKVPARKVLFSPLLDKKTKKSEIT